MPHYEARTHDRSLSDTSRITTDDGSIFKGESGRTESPDNDSAFSDTVSMLSSESSASSGGSGTKTHLRLKNIQQVFIFSEIKTLKCSCVWTYLVRKLDFYHR